MSRLCIIYKITNIITSQIYIGSSIDIKRRISRHFKDLKNGKHHSLKMQNSYNKYGKECFKVDYLTKFPEEYRKVMEQWFLDNNDCYYNNEKIVNKPSIGRVFSEEERKRAGQRMLANEYWKLTPPMSEENRLKASKRAKERIWTEYSRNKLSNSKMGNKSRLGQPHKESTKELMSKNSHNKRAVEQYDKSGNFIKEWFSIIKAAIGTNSDRASISMCCSGKRKTAGGYIWKYKDNQNENNQNSNK